MKIKIKEYFDKVGSLMRRKGFHLVLIKNAQTPEETRVYSKAQKRNSIENEIVVEVRKGKAFKFAYTDSLVVSFLDTDWMAPVTDAKYFKNRYDDFLASVKALKDA